MNYPYSIPPFLQNAMAQAFQAIMSGSPLPPNCYVMTVPIQQAQQMFPQMMNYGPGAGGLSFNPQPSYYGQLYQPQVGPYQYNQPPPPPPPSNTVVPYSNYYPPTYDQNYNHPIVPYGYENNHNGSKKKRHSNGPHSNVYNSSSFDSDMENLSWSRLFGTHHHRRQSKQHNSDQQASNYNGKKKQPNESLDTFTSTSESGSSSTTSDETIRRVNVATNQPTTSAATSKQQTKGSLPFKYSSEFVPGTARQQQQLPPRHQKPPKSSRKEVKVRSDDVFVIKKT